MTREDPKPSFGAVDYGRLLKLWFLWLVTAPFAAWRRLARSFETYTRILIEDDTLLGMDKDVPVTVIGRHAIIKVEIYKNVRIDNVTCDIFVELDGQLVFYAFDEETPGWKDLMAWLETMPGFMKTWPEWVIAPLFSENRTLVLDNQAARARTY